MPWDSVDKSRDEDLSDRRKWTRRLRKRGTGRRSSDEIKKGGLHEPGSGGVCGSIQENVAREEQ